MDRLRASADAILIGAGTLRADNPALHVRSAVDARPPCLAGQAPDGAAARAGHGQPARHRRRQPLLRPDARRAGRIIATVEDVAEDRLAAHSPPAPRSGRSAASRVDLPGRSAGTASPSAASNGCCVEGGGELNWAFLRDDLIDELHVTIAPVLLGGREAPTLLEGEGLAMRAQRKLRLEELHREGDELYCRYSVER